MSFLAPILASVAGSAASSLVSGIFGSSSSSGSTDPQQLMKEEQAQFEANFALQTHQAEIDNKNATNTAIGQSHAQTAVSSTAGAREVGDAQAHIVA